MSVTARLPRAARGFLARLLLMVAVLTGVLLAHGIQCTSAMAAPMPAAMPTSVYVTGPVSMPTALNGVGVHGGVQAMDTGQPRAAAQAGGDPQTEPRSGHAAIPTDLDGSVSDEPAPASSHRMVADSASEAPGTRGLLAACLVLLIAVAGVGVALRPRWRRLTSGSADSGRIAMTRNSAVAAPSLSKLCLLRT